MKEHHVDMDESLNRDSGLTRNQFLIWLGQEAAPDKPIFNEMSVFVIPGELDVERFHQAFQSMLDEVDALRTRVIREHGRPRAEILDHLRYESPLLDLSAEEDVEDALDAWALSRVDSAIDLAMRPFDSTLVRLASDRYAWVLLCHQILTDATSMSLVFQRVSDHYLRLDGRDAPSHADAPGFADYIKHQFDDAQTVKHRKREAYWKAKLADPPEPVVFYGGRSTPNTASRRQRVEHSLGPDLSAAVRGFATLDGIRCLSAHLSSYSVYCAALVLYLHKLSGQTRIALGSTWHNRPRSFESTVGLFMVQNPFEVEIEPDDTPRTLIKKVQSEALGTMRHLPYAAGNPGGRAYDVTLNYVKVVLGRFGDWPVEHRWYRPGFGDGSMQLQVHDVAGSQELTISIDFSTEVFSDADRAAMFGHYVACLNALIADPDQQIGSVAMLTDAERTRLEQWNDTVREYPHQATVLELIERQAELRPDAVAASDADEQITYAQLLERVRRLSRRLVAAGAGPGVSVGVLLNRSIDLIVGLLGVVGTGGAYVPLDPAFPRDRLEYMLEDSGARLLLTQMRLADSVRSGDRTVVHVDRLDAPLRDETAVVESVQPAPDGLAYILYTSGSTGRPKGVEISHKALANFLWSMADEPGCTADDTLLAVTTLSFDIAGLELYLPLIVGGHVEIASRECAADGRLLRSRLDVGGITMLQATPATWRMLLDAGWTGTTGLKALVGGEALPPELVQPLLDRTASVWNMYGPTETTIWSSTQRISAAATEITVGRPIANTGFHIMDAQLQPVPIGIAGELLVSGDGLARGYHDRPELTAEKFVHIAPLGSGAPVRMYRTGDLARFRRDGQVLHLGRLDHQVKIRGYRIELGEIEAVLVTHEGIRQAVVVAQDARTAAARLVAYVVPHGDSTPSPAELRAHLRVSLPDYMVPQQFVPLDELPLTLNGKIDRLRLPRADAATDVAALESSALSPIEARVAAAFCEVLELPSVSADADFFDVGGQSILALRLITRLGEEFGVELPLQTLFEASTVRALSERLSTLASTTPELRTVILEGTDLEARLRGVWRSAVGSEPPEEGVRSAPLADAQVVALLARVRQEFGVAAEGLSALAFRSDPTVPGLARALHDALNPPQTLVVPLQPRGSRKPLFLIHAGGGYVFFYRALAARLGPDQPVYAIRAATRRDSHRHRFDHTTSIEDLAARYLDEIKKIQPEGPYHLGGSCFGGVVAFEMGQQLLARGEAVDSPILLFDSYVGKVGGEDWGDYTSRTFSRVAERLGAAENAGRAELARLVLTSMVKRPVAVLEIGALAIRSLFRRVRGLLYGSRVRRWFQDTVPRARVRSSEQEQLDTMHEFLNTSIQLVSDYEPRRYPGSAVLLKATVGLDPEPLWTPWVDGGLEVHVMPGEHLDMMEEPWVTTTAHLVRQTLGAGRP